MPRTHARVGPGLTSYVPDRGPPNGLVVHREVLPQQHLHRPRLPVPQGRAGAFSTVVAELGPAGEDCPLFGNSKPKTSSEPNIPPNPGYQLKNLQALTHTSYPTPPNPSQPQPQWQQTSTRLPNGEQ